MNAITVLVAFTTTPLLVRWLGSEHYGTIRTLMDYFAVLSLFDLGVTRVASILLAEAVATGDSLQVAQAIRAGFLVMARVTAVLLAAGAALIFALPKLTAGTIPAADLRIAGAILMIPVALVPFSVARGLYDARQAGYAINILLILQAIVTTVLSLLFASRGRGIVGQALAVAIPQVGFVAVTMTILFRSHVPWRTVGSTPEVNARFWKLNWQVFGNNIASRLSFFSGNMIVAALLSPASVTAFYLTQRIATTVQAQLLSIPGSTWVGLLEMFRRGQHSDFRDRLMELTELISSLAGVAGVVIVSFNASFVARWIGVSGYAGHAVTVLAAMSLWCSVVSGMWTWLIGGMGEIGRWLPYSALSAVLTIAVSLTATKFLGVYGPLIGTVAAFLLVHTWALPRVMASLFPVTRGELAAAALRPLRWLIPFCVAAYVLSSGFTFASWPLLILAMAGTALAGVLLWLALGMNGDQRTRWRSRIWSAIRVPMRPLFVPVPRRD
jgi:O-antigen/teichoic acid export membrane protein